MTRRDTERAARQRARRSRGAPVHVDAGVSSHPALTALQASLAQAHLELARLDRALASIPAQALPPLAQVPSARAPAILGLRQPEDWHGLIRVCHPRAWRVRVSTPGTASRRGGGAGVPSPRRTADVGEAHARTLAAGPMRLEAHAHDHALRAERLAALADRAARRDPVTVALRLDGLVALAAGDAARAQDVVARLAGPDGAQVRRLVEADRLAHACALLAPRADTWRARELHARASAVEAPRLVPGVDGPRYRAPKAR